MTINDTEIDEHIIKAIQAGNRDAFAQLYDRHNAWLMAIAYRILQNHRDAEDLLHDVFLEIWKTVSSYNAERGTVQSWLAVKTRSRALDRLRALNKEKSHLAEAAETELIAEPVSNENACVIDHALARKMLEQLNPVQRTVIELSYFRGFTCQEIANHCHMPLGTVKSGLLRAVQTLRREFNSNKVSATCP